MQSVLDQTTMPGASVKAHRRYPIAVENLQQEMFVAELDRPWLDTPFLLQGFMIDSKVELDTLIKYCDYVYVDLELSSPAVADAIRRLEMRPAGTEPEPAWPTAQRLPTQRLPSQQPPLQHLSPQHLSSQHPASQHPFPQPPGSQQVASQHTSQQPAFHQTAPAQPYLPSAPRLSDPSFRPARSSDTTDDSPAGRSPAEAGERLAGDEPPTSRNATRRQYQPRADVKISQTTRQRFRQFVRQAAEPLPAVDPSRLGRWFGRFFKRPERESRTDFNHATPPAPADLLPPGVQRTCYEDRQSMLEELPLAREAFGEAEAAMVEMMAAVRGGRPVPLQSIKAAVKLIVRSMLNNPDALMWIARLREEEINAHNHGVRVALYLVALGRHLGLPEDELECLGSIGMLGDIGKGKLPRAILEKPGMLSPGEFELVKQHVNLTLQVLAGLPDVPPAVISGIAQRHERADGSGYPNRLKDREIGVYGKMAAIADSYAALITPRAYANALAPQDALMNLYQWSGTSFHEPMVEQFVQAIGVFPVGSMIELDTGEVGVVVAHDRDRRLEPKVLVLSNADKSVLAQPMERDLAEGQSRADGPSRIARSLPMGAFGFKLRDYYLDEAAGAEADPAS